MGELVEAIVEKTRMDIFRGREAMTEKEIYDDFVNELMRVITGIDSVLARMYETSAPKQYKETRGHVRRAKMALVDALETYVQQAYSDDEP